MAGDPLSPGGGEQNVAIEGQGGKCQFVQTEDERRSKLEQRLPALQVGGAPSHTHRIIPLKDALIAFNTHSRTHPNPLPAT